MGDPFSVEIFSKILSRLSETTVHHADTELSVEFKETFSFGGLADYGRTLSAFANAGGGYVIFGIKDDPREIVGVKSTQFSRIEPANITKVLNAAFEPALNWSHAEIDYGELKLGILHVAESLSKPVICKKTEKSLRQGAIYFRYLGQTEEIRYAELARMINQEREKVHRDWMHMLSKVARLGVSQVGLLDLESGEVSGSTSSFYISEELLPKLKFINEGKFTESEGEPTLRLLGDLHVGALSASGAPSTEIVQVPTHIDSSDVIRAFLRQEHVTAPHQWLLTLLSDPATYFPLHYFRKEAKMTIPELVAFLKTSGVRGQNRKGLIALAECSKTFSPPTVAAETAKARLRLSLLNQMLAQTLSEADFLKDLDRALEAIWHLNENNSDLRYILRLLSAAFENYANMPSPQAGRLRTTIAYVDKAWFSKA
jgi:hypothetical protein